MNFEEFEELVIKSGMTTEQVCVSMNTTHLEDLSEEQMDEKAKVLEELISKREKEAVKNLSFEKFDATSSLSYEFSEIDDRRKYIRHYKTGIRAIDEVTAGGLEIGLGIFNGVSGAGKTTFAVQIAANIAKSGVPVLFFSLEQEKGALIAKLISAQSFLSPGSSTCFAASDILSETLASQKSEEEKSCYKAMVRELSEQLGGNLMIIDRPTAGKPINSEMIVDIATEFMRQTGKRPVIFVDYLQRLAPNKSVIGASKMEIVDENTNTLWDFAHEKKLCILAIGSLPKSSYKEGATLEGNKHSGNIEYSIDFGFGIQFAGFDRPGFNFNDAKKANPRKVEIVVLKQRLGEGGEAIPFTYYPAYNAFVADADVANVGTTIGSVEADTSVVYEVNETEEAPQVTDAVEQEKIDDEDEGFDPLACEIPLLG